ncbi:hypothetical protein MARPO_0052s0045 [Marchantia polymorpha]|uniref:Uncharacterized protein n=1 Tax=Marchantia polymorpha TaxID=3197 RepID=A0A2R6WWL1_MARPO|nr:hypothetical protein MARPO_0052s0045 [Marchantia polymorpha]|eukprot:PTQ38247.1 hypothetical protein MARPO_0052s0045 [Marchantia polymorpha]
MTVVAEEDQSVADTESLVVISSDVPTPLIWDMDGIAVGTIELDDFIQEFDMCGGVSIGINGDASSSISEGTSGAVDATGTSTSSGVNEAQAVLTGIESWTEGLRMRVCDATLMSDSSPTLAHVFALSEKIELNMVEERVMTSTFARDTTTTSRISHNTSPSRPMGGGGGSRGVHTRHPSASATSAIENAMAVRIEQLEQRLAAMAGLGASTSTSYEGEDFSYLASAAQVEASVAVTRDGAHASEPRDATLKLDPQRATELMNSGIDLARVFRVAATSCERERVTATSAEIREDTVEDPSSTSTLFEKTTWQAAAARMESLPTQPAIDRERIVPDVCMVDNRSGLFWLVYVPTRVLLDSDAQPLMLGKAACISLGIRRSELKPCPFQIQTSLGGASDRSYFMTTDSILMQLGHDHAHDSSKFGVHAVVTSAESYDVLVDGVVLYPMGFWIDYWMETTAYRLGWQSGDERLSELPGNSSTDDTPVYEEVEEIVRLAAAVSSSLDVPLWNSCQALQLEADRLVKKAWNEASLPAEPERDSADQLVCGSSALSPLVTIHIAWEYSL